MYICRRMKLWRFYVSRSVVGGVLELIPFLYIFLFSHLLLSHLKSHFGKSDTTNYTSPQLPSTILFLKIPKDTLLVFILQTALLVIVLCSRGPTFDGLLFPKGIPTRKGVPKNTGTSLTRGAPLAVRCAKLSSRSLHPWSFLAQVRPCFHAFWWNFSKTMSWFGECSCNTLANVLRRVGPPRWLLLKWNSFVVGLRV